MKHTSSLLNKTVNFYSDFDDKCSTKALEHQQKGLLLFGAVIVGLRCFPSQNVFNSSTERAFPSFMSALLPTRV